MNDARAAPYRRLVPVASALLGGLLATALVAARAHSLDEERVRLEFEAAASTATAAIARHVESQLVLMRALRAWRQAVGEVGPTQFHAFVDPILESTPGVRALEYVPHVTRLERPAFERAMSRLAGEPYAIRVRDASGQLVTAPDSADYFPVADIEQGSGRNPVLGFDLFSDPVRREAIERSWSSGQPAATARVVLVRDQELGFLVFLPVYDARSNLTGLVSGVFVLEALVSGAIAAQPELGLGLTIDDLSAVRAEQQRLFERHASQPGATFDAMTDVGGRRWRLRATMPAAFGAQRRSQVPTLLLAGGSLVSLLLAAYLYGGVRRTDALTAANQALRAEIVERERAERAVAASEEGLRRAAHEWYATFDALREGILVIDDAGLVRRANRTACALAGSTELEGRAFAELASSEPWRALDELRAGVAGRGEADTREIREADSGTSWLLGASPLPWPSAGAWTILSFRDLTETALLRERVARGEHLAAMGSLVAGVAHEVRTPLFGITASLDAYAEDVADSPEAKEFLNLLRANVTRLTQLMSDLLEYGKPSALRPRMGDPCEPVRLAIRACAAQAEAAGVAITLDAAPDLPRVSRDPVRLEQVFVNLIQNAVQHSPRGGRVSIRAEATAGGVAFVVEDEGPGLVDADLHRLFEPFYSRRKGGTGLGLPIVQRIVEAHGGVLTAVRPRQPGARFRVELPPRTPGEARG